MRVSLRAASRALAFGAAAALASCLELSGPPDGVVSVSTIEVPSTAVAVGDVLRDSAGAPARLRVAAFDADGDTIAVDDLRWAVLDSGATVDAQGLVRGTSARAAVRVIAILGGLQTAPARFAVVPAPVSVRDSSVAAVTFAAGSLTDSVSAPFGVRLLAADGSGVPSWPVRFSIVRSTVVPRSATVAPVELVGDARTRSTIDTTDAQGYGLRALRVTPLAMDLTRLQSRVVDTVYVRVSAVIGIGATARRRDTTLAIALRPLP